MLLSTETIDIQAVLAHLVVEDPLGRAQQTSGLRTIAPRGFQRIENQVSFVRCNRFAKGQPGECSRSLGGLKCRGKMVAVNHGAITDQDGALDDILEFANVSRPVIRGQHVDGRC